MYVIYHPLKASKDICKLLFTLLELGQLEVVQEYCRNNPGWSFVEVDEDKSTIQEKVDKFIKENSGLSINDVLGYAVYLLEESRKLWR